jgi:uncharacterized membrane protein YoaK (UPF0700 family)
MKAPITEEQVTRYLGVRLLLILGTFCGAGFGAVIGWWAIFIPAILLFALIPLTIRDINRVYKL